MANISFSFDSDPRILTVFILKDDDIKTDLTHYRRIVLLTDGASNPFLAKTAISMLRYRTADICAILDRNEVGKTAGELFGCGGTVPVVASINDVEQPDALFIGIAPPGGKLPNDWREIILLAINTKLDVVSGLHQFLSDDSLLAEAAKRTGANLIDVRKNNHKEMATGKGLNTNCFRVHTVGQDCSVGKMVTAIEIQKCMVDRGLDAAFAATGQTGIMITGQGVPIDCVVADFINGAAEELVRENDSHDYLLVEGQGCITHPAYSAVTLGLLHGCAPDALIFCYEARRTHVKGFGDVRLQPLSLLKSIYEQVASTRHPCKIAGVAMNGRMLNDAEYIEERDRIKEELGLPVCDVYRDGAGQLVDAILRHQKEAAK